MIFSSSITNSKVLFLVGLPGSGKTHYIESHFEELRDYTVLDDTSHSFNKESLVGTIQNHPLIVIADPFLCRGIFREAAKRLFANFEQTWIFFENSPEICFANVAYRNDGRHVSESFIKSLSREYEIPTDAFVVAVVSGEASA